VDAAARIISCWKALSKQVLTTDHALAPKPYEARRRLLSRNRSFIILDKSKAGKIRCMTYHPWSTEGVAFSL